MTIGGYTLPTSHTHRIDVRDDFERSPPPPPLPLEDWLLRRDRADRYREPFFSGRVDDYGAFRDAARGLARGSVGGETLIFQGAPGAGKSALMHECIAAVRAHSTFDEPWVAVEVAPGTLRYPPATVSAIASAVGKERARLATAESRWRGAIEKGSQGMRGTFASASRRGVGAAGVRVGGEPQNDGDASAAFHTIERLCRGARVLVFVDEAQNTPAGAEDMLDCMSRGFTGVTLQPVFFGLGDTAEVLEKRGISRPPAERLIDLAPLSESDTGASLAMTFDAYHVHGRERERWLSELIVLSQGWPQHLNRVAVSACRVAKEYGMNVDQASLDDALSRGMASKAEYYGILLRGVPARYLGVYKRLAMQLSPTGATRSLVEDDVRAIARAAGMDDGQLREVAHGIVASRTGGPVPQLDRALLHPAPVPDDASLRPAGHAYSDSEGLVREGWQHASSSAVIVAARRRLRARTSRTSNGTRSTLTPRPRF